MGRKKKEREAKRVTLYVDAEVHEETKALADKLGMSLSALTRAMYVIALSFNRVMTDVQQEMRELEMLYPDGVPEEKAQAYAQDFLGRFHKISQRWATYSSGMLMGAGFPGIQMGPAEVMPPAELFKVIGAELEGIKRLGELIEDHQPE